MTRSLHKAVQIISLRTGLDSRSAFKTILVRSAKVKLVNDILCTKGKLPIKLDNATLKKHLA